MNTALATDRRVPAAATRFASDGSRWLFGRGHRGGVKASGYGREGSVHGLADDQHIKYVCEGGLD